MVTDKIDGYLSAYYKSNCLCRYIQVEKVERVAIAYKLRERKMSKRKKKGESVNNIRGDLPITITAIKSCPILNIKNICGFLTKKDSYI